MDFGEQTTGTRDEHYNLVSVLYHALHGAENCERYVLDAEAAGDERLAAFFRVAQAAQMETAERAKGLLGIGGDAVPGVAPSGTPRGTGTVTPPRPDDVQREAQREADVRAEEVTAPTERSVPRDPDETTPTAGETAEDVAPSRGVPSDAPPRGEDVAWPESARRAVPPDAPRTEEPPPRKGDAPPSPSEQPPR